MPWLFIFDVTDTALEVHDKVQNYIIQQLLSQRYPQLLVNYKDKTWYKTSPSMTPMANL